MLDGHDDFDIVAGKDPSAYHESVDTGKHRDAADIGSNQKMQNADSFITLYAKLPKISVQSSNFKTLFIMDGAVVSLRHDKRNEFGIAGNRAEQTAFLAVAHTSAASFCHVVSSWSCGNAIAVSA